MNRLKIKLGGLIAESPPQIRAEAGEVVSFRFSPAEVNGYHSQYLEARSKAIGTIMSKRSERDRFQEKASDGTEWEFVLERGHFRVNRVRT